MKRFNPDIKVGLTNLEVNSRMFDGLVNYDTSVPTKTVSQIIRKNTINIFNIVNLFLACIVIVCGILSKESLIDTLKNVTFLGVVIVNTIISTIQELTSKKIVDKLSVINQTQVLVLRESVWQFIDINEIVLDDVLKFKIGNQVVVDSIILDGVVEVNESFITGESKSVLKKQGDKILSGSFIVSGEAIVRVDSIGDDNYTSKITSSAKYIKKVNSKLMDSLNWVIKIASRIIIPLGIIMFIRQYNLPNNNLNTAAINTVAALVMMIPEGLVLLTSTVLAVSVMRLAKYKVLVQELYCIETLARVDTLCLDKTGTLTEGIMEVYDCINVSDIKYDDVLYTISHNLVLNPTLEAIKNKIKGKNINVKEKIEFSSLKKYSGIVTDNKTYFLGAPDILLKGNLKEYDIDKYLDDYRVLCLAYTDKETKEISNLKPMCFLLIRDKIRKTALKTLEYFKEQNVDIKIISGDNLKTVEKIASRLNIEGKAVDMSEVDDVNAIVDSTIFARVTPEQKKEIILALKQNGHTVAMTGDGVNDVLALKEADCSIAMKSGADAAKNVSQLVLLDSNFDSLPHVVYEGRKTINNITRSATLFLSKTGYAFLLMAVYLLLGLKYPFEPIQISLVSVVTIGIPSFILALEPNKDRIKGSFLKTVLLKSVPVSLTVISSVLLIELSSLIFTLTNVQKSTLDVIIIGLIGFMLIYKICVPLNKLRKFLIISMFIVFTLGVTLFRNFFSLSKITLTMFILLIVIIFISIGLFKIFNYLFEKYTLKKEKV